MLHELASTYGGYLFEAKRDAVKSEPCIAKALDIYLVECAFLCMEPTDLKDAPAIAALV